MRKKIRTSNLGLALSLALASVSMLLFYGIGPARAATSPSSEKILNFHSDIIVRADGSLRVRESIREHSEAKEIVHGIYRDFPTRYRDHLGNRYVVVFKILEATRDGRPEKFRNEAQSNGVRIYLGDPKESLPPGDYTYTLSYTVTRELGFFPDHDELYWNVTGNGWIFPIGQASATVTLPAGVQASSVRFDGYTGLEGERGKAFQVSRSGENTVDFTATQPLAAKEGLTLVVAWPKGFVREPTRQDRLRYFLEDNAPEVAGLAGLLVVLLYYTVVWAWIGRDPAKRSLMPLYEPPAGVSPAAMRYLVRMGFDEKTLTAAVIDMAVKKFLTIKEKNGTFRLERSDGTQQLLAPEEKAAAGKLFGDSDGAENDGAGHGREAVALIANCSALREALAAVKKSLHQAEDNVYFQTHRRYLIPGIFLSVATLAGIVVRENQDARIMLGFLALWLSIWSVAVFFLARQAMALWKGARAGGSLKRDLGKQARSMTIMAAGFSAFEVVALVALAYFTSWVLVLLLAALVAVNFLFHRWLKAPTRAGRDLLEQIEGFRMFLTEVDGDRLNRLTPPAKTPELFEKYLPYAVALDSELAWARQFSAVLDQARQRTGYSPGWYAGARPWAAAAFASSLGGSFSSAIAASAAAPGGASGRGGGFSGGGGGGGGGGGW